MISNSAKKYIFFIWAAVILLYSVAWGHNFLFDEENLILRNPLIKDPSNFFTLFTKPFFYFETQKEVLWNQYYRPLTSLTFMADYHFWKTNPFGFNVTNTILHALVSSLFFILLNKMLQNSFASFLGALLYAVQPIHTEAVTYLASRGDLLVAFFLILTLLSYWDGRRVLALFLYGVSLFCKESALLIPAYLLLLDMSFIQNKLSRLLRNLVPFMIVALLFLIFRQLVCPMPSIVMSTHWKESLLRVLSMGKPFLYYLQSLILPDSFRYSLTINNAKNFKDPIIVETLLILLIFLSLWLMTLRRRAGPVFWAFSFFAISFLPALQIIHFYPEWAMHYLYIPSLGLFTLLGSLICCLMQAKRKTYFQIFLILYAPFVLFLSFRTWHHNKLYNDPIRYYDWLSLSDSIYARYGYQHKAIVLLEQNRLDEAIIPLRIAFRLEPHSPATLNALGVYHLKKQDLKKAHYYFKEAYKNSPRNYMFLLSAGKVLLALERYEEALQTFLEIQKEMPYYVSIYPNLLVTYEILGEPKKALEWANRGLEIPALSAEDRMILVMGIVRLSYRHEWDEVLRQTLSTALKDHPDIFWYSDVAKLLLGGMDQRTFMALVEEKYSVFQPASKSYILMSYILQNNQEEATRFFRQNIDFFETEASQHLLVRKEIERARRILEEVTTKAF